MVDQPLQPFAPPSFLFDKLVIPLSPGLALTILLYLVFVLWGVYTLIAVYHWLRYSHASLVAFPAIGVHLFVSLALMTYALTGISPI